MKWTIRKLREHRGELLHFDVTLALEESLQARENSIIHLAPVQVAGYILARETEFILHCQAKTVVTLPSTRTLQPVEVPMEVPISERYVYEEHDANAEDYEETTIVLEYDYIDLEVAVIDSLLLNLPVRVVGENELSSELPSGKHWSVVTEDDYQQQKVAEQSEQIDPRFASLKALLNEDNADA
ncbi:MAG: YceD family protein [Aerococcaceae bacterium]|nr:YceD family protein [Aerococcaceae bacterium]